MSRRRESGLSSRSRPARTAADTARTRNLAPSSPGASSIAASASAWASARSPPWRTAISARSDEMVTTVSAAPRARAWARISSAPRRAASKRPAIARTPSAKSAQFSPRWGSSGRPAAIARSARSIALSAERRYSTSFIASVASVVASSTVRAGPPGSRRAAISASASRRADAEVELRPSSATSSCSRAGSPAGSRS